MAHEISTQKLVSHSETSELLRLPVQILTIGDVSRLSREIDSIETFFMDASLRGGANTKTVPQVSQLLNIILNENNLNILQKADRAKIKEFLKIVLSKAPIVHASFATDPRPDFLMKLMGWFRKEAHPYTLFKIGLQPAIAAGCVLRTTNKYFDFSFKKHFADSKSKLGTALKAVK